MLKIIRTNSGNKSFQELVRDLDRYLAIMDGDDHAYYHQFNKIDVLKQVVVAFDNEVPAGCGAIKEYSEKEMEVKRMFVKPEMRNKGIASGVLKELEYWASEMGFQKCVLETGRRQTEAISFYAKSGYKIIPNYGQYTDMENSVCFEKFLNK